MKRAGWMGVVLFVAVALAAVSARAKQEAKVDISVVGLQVAAAPYNGEQGMSSFYSEGGVTLSMLAVSNAGSIVKLDEEASKIDSVTDEQGNQLLKEDQWSTLNYMNTVSEDGKAILFSVNAAGQPARGSKTIQVKGAVTVVCATGSKTVKSAPVEAKPGVEVEINGAKFTVAKIGKPDYDDSYAYSIELKSADWPDSVAAIRFLDTAGKVIESTRSSSMWSGTNRSEEHYLRNQVDTVILEIDFWENLESIQTPIDLTVGAGL